MSVAVRSAVLKVCVGKRVEFYVCPGTSCWTEDCHLANVPKTKKNVCVGSRKIQQMYE